MAKVKVLVLGGSRFLGRAIVESATRAGHEVTCFRRRDLSPLPQVRVVTGDRTNPADITRLARLDTWDAIIDTSAYLPNEVGQIARSLQHSADRYVLVSTVAVYRDWPALPTDETSPVWDCPPDASGDSYSYGALKAGCESAVKEAFGADRTVILRPGAIIGPHDYLGRLPWWLHRVADGGRIAAPGDPERIVRPIDVHDVAEFALQAAIGLAGVFNVAGTRTDTMRDLLHACRSVTGADATFEWITDEQWLTTQDIAAWTGLPLWRIERGVWQTDTSRAQNLGLTSRPLIDTLIDTWAWLSATANPLTYTEGNGIPRSHENEILRRWDRYARHQEVRLWEESAGDSNG